MEGVMNHAGFLQNLNMKRFEDIYTKCKGKKIKQVEFLVSCVEILHVASFCLSQTGHATYYIKIP